ncbi:hypothetical protein A33M_0254 [Rhodovulum sp. PH10]|nr:hypothetical protein A33M_0254 [Rhodovulum sp. PH10]
MGETRARGEGRRDATPRGRSRSAGGCFFGRTCHRAATLPHERYRTEHAVQAVSWADERSAARSGPDQAVRI